MQYPKMYRVALLGERGVGKSSFISRLTDNCLADEEPFVLKHTYQPNIKQHTHIIQVMHNQKLHTVTFVEFDEVEPRHLNFKRDNTIPFRFDAYLLIYDVSEPRSEEYAQHNSTLGPPNSCETRASSRSSGRYVSMSSILTRNRRNPYISIVGNFADKLNFTRKIDKTQKHHSAYDMSTKYDFNVYRFFLDLVKKLFDGEMK